MAVTYMVLWSLGFTLKQTESKRKEYHHQPDAQESSKEEDESQ